MASNRDYLTQLDAAIGDADHGINMDRGFSAAATDLEAAADLPPGEILRTGRTTLIYRVGGAAGPLFGTGFRRRRPRSARPTTFEAEDLLKALRPGLDAIQGLGAAAEGDKTIVDAYMPALHAFERELRAGRDVAVGREPGRRRGQGGHARHRPDAGAEGSRLLPGPRSVGHQDPGATSTSLLFARSRALDATGTA